MRKKKRDNDSIMAFWLHLIFFKRRRHRLFPLISAFSGCLLLYLFASSLLISSPPITNHHRRLSSPSKNEATVWDFSDSEKVFLVPKGGGSLDRDIWSSSLSKFYYGCSNASRGFQTAEMKTDPNRYLVIYTSGGLNQQRTGIIDAVVAAYILNTTLVVPKLDQKSFWKDSSDFADIFDVEWFISFLSNDVKVIKELPKKNGKVITPYPMGVPRKCTPKCYENKVLPALIKKHVVRLRKFDYRLSNRLDTELQKLRCRVNYHGLQFANDLLHMGKMLIERMKMKSQQFIALHLRFEPDMLAFSGCYYGGGEKERTELGAIRKRWKSLHVSNPEKVRRHGRCPLTPEEVGLMLRALGFGSDVHIYVASGEVYGGEETLAPLKALFPHFHSKETLATKDELAPFSPFSSRMAALDFIVCDESDVFVTNNNGNMAKMLAGRRKYFGHKRTIRPNAKKLYKLFMNRQNMTWEEFSSRIRTHQIGFMGEPKEVKPGRGEFHENPSSCICENSDALRSPNGNQVHDILQSSKENIITNEISNVTDELSTEDDHEQDLSESDYTEGRIGSREKYLSNEILSDDSLSLKPELEELFSD